MNRSLRIRLLVATSLASAIVLALLCAAIYAAMWRLMMSDYDAALLAKARALAATAEQKNGRVKVEFDPVQMPEFSSREHPDYFQIWQDDGRVLQRSDSLEGADLPGNEGDAHALSGRLVLPHTRHARAMVLKFTPPAEDEGEQGASNRPLRTCTIAVAGTPTQSREMLARLGWLLCGLCALAIVVSGAILVRVVNHALQPVNTLAHEIERIRETDLAARLASKDVPAELLPIIERLNGLLDRLQKAFDREKAFTADVAHELRTPLAGLLTTLEVCISRPREGPGYVSAIRECCGMTERMQSMVENLLMLARVDAGQVAVSHAEVCVAALLREVWAMYELRAQACRLQLQWDLDERCASRTDIDKLRIILQNVLDNAVSYTPESGGIRIGSAIRAGWVRIEIANSGCSLVPEDVPYLFERFWRGDRERSDTQLHCGLGLSLTQRLVNLIGGRIGVTVRNGEFVVGLDLPGAISDESKPAAPERLAPVGMK